MSAGKISRRDDVAYTVFSVVDGAVCTSHRVLRPCRRRVKPAVDLSRTVYQYSSGSAELSFDALMATPDGDGSEWTSAAYLSPADAELLSDETFEKACASLDIHIRGLTISSSPLPSYLFPVWSTSQLVSGVVDALGEDRTRSLFNVIARFPGVIDPKRRDVAALVWIESRLLYIGDMIRLAACTSVDAYIFAIVAIAGVDASASLSASDAMKTLKTERKSTPRLVRVKSYIANLPLAVHRAVCDKAWPTTSEMNPLKEARLWCKNRSSADVSAKGKKLYLTAIQRARAILATCTDETGMRAMKILDDVTM
jgi:hypothetical protein